MPRNTAPTKGGRPHSVLAQHTELDPREIRHDYGAYGGETIFGRQASQIRGRGNGQLPS